MLVLSIRTDKPEAEIGLFDEQKRLDYITWEAHRELSKTLHQKIDDLLVANGKTLDNLEGILCFQGPGSFTGLRIGLTVANALAYGKRLPIIATMDDDWISTGIARLHAGEDDKIALPHYGSEAHITKQRK